ncbi:hypothetical protein BURK1_02472 [Burkholderiales bacterium]|nr:hypothetical protein BURK1_02472 [Burkholderiales bacterium]
MTTPAATRGLASVIVALNPHDHDFTAVLDAWAVQAAAGDYEVIVAHDGCRPTLGAEYASHRLRHASTPVRLVDSAVNGRAASNNAGVRASRGDLLIFVADDFRPSRGLVAAHRTFHELIGRPAVGIGPGFFDEARRVEPFVRWLEDSGRIWGVSFTVGRFQWREDFFYVGNASMPRAVFDAVGGFDESFRHDLVDDWEFGERLRATGVTRHLVARAIAWHDHDVTLDERLVAGRRMGECAAEHERRAPMPPSWAAAVSRPVEDHERAVQAILRRTSGSGSFADRAEGWKAEIHLALMRGYHAALRKASPRQSTG